MDRLQIIKEGAKHLNFSGALFEDFNWLIEQAEKVEELQKEIERLEKHIHLLER